jgi:hypothetical protein
VPVIGAAKFSYFSRKELKKLNETITPTYMNTNFIEIAKVTSENLKNNKSFSKNPK